MPKLIVLFYGVESPASTLAEAAADGAKAVRFTEVDVRAGSSHEPTAGRRHKSLDSRGATEGLRWRGDRGAGGGRGAGGTRGAPRCARARGAGRRVREHRVRGPRRRQHDASRERRAVGRHHRDGAARRGRSRGSGTGDGEARREGGGMGATCAEPRASRTAISPKSITATTIRASITTIHQATRRRGQKAPSDRSGLFVGVPGTVQSTNSTVTGFLISPASTPRSRKRRTAWRPRSP